MCVCVSVCTHSKENKSHDLQLIFNTFKVNYIQSKIHMQRYITTYAS